MRDDVGFTGTRQGMTVRQTGKLDVLLHSMNTRRLRFGDAIGADEETFWLAKGSGYHTIAHPARDHTQRAFCPADLVLPPLLPLARNQVIVDLSAIMLATPAECEEQPRGGTWATIRYARRVAKPLIIIQPDGETVMFNMERAI